MKKFREIGSFIKVAADAPRLLKFSFKNQPNMDQDLPPTYEEAMELNGPPVSEPPPTYDEAMDLNSRPPNYEDIFDEGPPDVVVEIQDGADNQVQRRRCGWNWIVIFVLFLMSILAILGLIDTTIAVQVLIVFFLLPCLFVSHSISLNNKSIKLLFKLNKSFCFYNLHFVITFRVSSARVLTVGFGRVSNSW